MPWMGLIGAGTGLLDSFGKAQKAKESDMYKAMAAYYGLPMAPDASNESASGIGSMGQGFFSGMGMGQNMQDADARQGLGGSGGGEIPSSTDTSESPQMASANTYGGPMDTSGYSLGLINTPAEEKYSLTGKKKAKKGYGLGSSWDMLQMPTHDLSFMGAGA